MVKSKGSGFNSVILRVWLSGLKSWLKTTQKLCEFGQHIYSLCTCSFRKGKERKGKGRKGKEKEKRRGEGKRGEERKREERGLILWAEKVDWERATESYFKTEVHSKWDIYTVSGEHITFKHCSNYHFPLLPFFLKKLNLIESNESIMGFHHADVITRVHEGKTFFGYSYWL